MNKTLTTAAVVIGLFLSSATSVALATNNGHRCDLHWLQKGMTDPRDCGIPVPDSGSNNTNTNTNSNKNVNSNRNHNSNRNNNTNTANGGDGGNGVGVGIGIGKGGNAVAHGGNASAKGGRANADANSNSTSSARGGSVSDSGNSRSNSSVRDSGNSTASSNQRQAQDQSQSQSASADNSNSGNSNVTVDASSYHEAQRRAPVNTAHAAALTSSNDTCMGSSSLGGQGVTFGFSIAKTWTDKDCVLRKDARLIHNMQRSGVAMSLMCSKPSVLKAIEMAGTDADRVACGLDVRQIEVESRDGEHDGEKG